MKKHRNSIGLLCRAAMVLALFVTVACVASPAGARQKRALVIGIGNYPESSGWSIINGHRDVNLITGMLEQNGFERGNIATLIDGQAVKSAVTDAFKALVSNADPGDTVYIHFSGHGQQVTDIDGDEEDGLDEAIIPYDAAISYGLAGYKGEKHILDDDLNGWLDRIKDAVGPKGELMVILDACHSGDATRGSGSTRISVRGTADVFSLSDPSGEQPAGKSPTKSPSDRKTLDWICLSACKSYQSNYEYKSDDGYYGRLSWALSRVLKPGIGFDDMVSGLKEMYDSLPLPPGPPQELDVEAPAGYMRELFEGGRQ